MKTTTVEEFLTLVETHSGPIDLIVGPDVMAEVLKMRSAGDRAISNTRVASYVDDMSSGRWKPIGDPITFDVNGVRTNGQHRAEAVVRFGGVVKMPFRFGADEGVYALHDSGVVRSLADVMVANQIGGNVIRLCGSNGRRLAAVIHLITSIDLGQTSKLSRVGRARIRHDVKKIYDGHAEAVEWFFETVKRSAKTRATRKEAFMASPIASAFIQLYGLYDKTVLTNALKKLCTGENIPSGDAIGLLREYTLGGLASKSGGMVMRDDSIAAFAKAISAIEASVERKERSRMNLTKDLQGLINRIIERRKAAGLYVYTLPGDADGLEPEAKK